MNHFISKSCYKGAILHKNYKKITTNDHFNSNSFLEFNGKKMGFQIHNQAAKWKIFNILASLNSSAGWFEQEL